MANILAAVLAPVLVVLFIILLYFGRRYFAGGACKVSRDLTGKIVVITGSNTGIGKETAIALANLNATIIIACRDPKRSIPVVDEIKKKTGNSKIVFMKLDLSDLESISIFADEFKRKYTQLHILINNAGVMMIPERTLTKDGFEMQFGTNHLGHFYLTQQLLDVIEKSAPSRIINVSSMGHYSCKKINWDDIMYEKGYDLNAVYFQSKLANVLFTKKLQEILKGKNVTVVSLHPGVVRTELARYLQEKWYIRIVFGIMKPIIYYTFKTPTQGAQTTLYCALEDQDKLKGGMYYSDCKVKKENPLALDKQNADRLWDLSKEFISKVEIKV